MACEPKSANSHARIASVSRTAVSCTARQPGQGATEMSRGDQSTSRLSARRASRTAVRSPPRCAGNGGPGRRRSIDGRKRLQASLSRNCARSDHHAPESEVERDRHHLTGLLVPARFHHSASDARHLRCVSARDRTAHGRVRGDVHGDLGGGDHAYQGGAVTDRDPTARRLATGVVSIVNRQSFAPNSKATYNADAVDSLGGSC